MHAACMRLSPSVYNCEFPNNTSLEHAGCCLPTDVETLFKLIRNIWSMPTTVGDLCIESLRTLQGLN